MNNLQIKETLLTQEYNFLRTNPVLGNNIILPKKPNYDKINDLVYEINNRIIGG